MTHRLRVMALAATVMALLAACQSGPIAAGPDASSTSDDLGSTTSGAPANTAAILAKLVTYDKTKSPGPTKDYYWVNGAARITKTAMPQAGKAKFTYDNDGRSSIARATLTYALYAASKGSRQGNPLDPPGWPSSNPEVYSTSALTGKTSHTYLWNRSHSIADSLLGALSYSSNANFTAGTKDQNVGADDNGGMRAAEEVAEKYWAAHPNSTVVIWYQTTPLYSGSNMIPSGSIVDELSSDGYVNKEIVVLNDEEDITVNYSGSSV
jgi:DNA-entry nuclease